MHAHFRNLVFASLLTGAAACHAQLTASEKDGLVDALFLAGLRIEDLRVYPSQPQTKHRLALLDQALANPLEAVANVQGMHEIAMRAPSSLLETAILRTFGEPKRYGLESPVDRPVVPNEIPESLQPIVRDLAVAVAVANAHVRIALSRLLPHEQRELIEGLPQIASPGESFEFARQKPPSLERAWELLGRVDLDRILFAAHILALGVERRLPDLRRAAGVTDWVGEVRFLAGGMPVIVGGKGPNTYTDRSAVLLIDLGGDDSYSGRHGAGPGYASVLIDVSGNDTYHVPDLSLGAGLLGIGFAYDLAGDDNYRGKSLCLGAGLAGVGLFVDESGDDAYQAGSMTQGFGMFGVGICKDSRGADSYRSAALSQGAARTLGFGWLIDVEGDDQYVSSGDRRLSVHPMVPSLSCSQGASLGFESVSGGFAGGIGLLSDLAGNDSYRAEALAQGAAMWHGIASLYDAKGDDSYRAARQAQASADEGSVGMFFDLGGSDLYFSEFGSSQSCAVGRSFALLLDREGNDSYMGRWNSPAFASRGGLAILLDALGEDIVSGSAGVVPELSAEGAVAVFLDLAGTDQIGAPPALSGIQVRPGQSVSYDVQASLAAPFSTSEAAAGPVPGSRQLTSASELSDLVAAIGTPPDPSFPASRVEAIRSLVSMGVPAVRWIGENRLTRLTRAEMSGFVAVVDGVGVPARELLASWVGNPSEEVARAALWACSEGGFEEAAPHLTAAFDRPSLRLLALEAAGRLNDAKAAPRLNLLCADPDPAVAFRAMEALARMGESSAIGTADALLASSNLPLRQSAWELLSQFPDHIRRSAPAMIASGDALRARAGIRLLAKVGDAEALLVIARALDDPRTGVKVEALLALEGRCPPEFRPAILRLRQDPDARVRAVAQATDPGR
ncbi:MAG: hypothetical protein AMXMBFR19_07240 [Chthonomonadaceae bacterium]|uniref:HEAT repeat domain-containing protein n=1 Tax=Candidatus Nitrosymbiomonas proteolyticus TaxID=2608984 RepID=A0A809SEU0_9BACT|nr:conserved hypothetical protein [Candidatus Nitrosymbiomonas proteolyticus]